MMSSAQPPAESMQVAAETPVVRPSRAKRCPEWMHFEDCGPWQLQSGEASKFRVAKCKYCVEETRIRGKIETMHNHIEECPHVPAAAKIEYNAHPQRFRKRPAAAGAATGAAAGELSKRTKAGTHSIPPGMSNVAAVLHGVNDLRIDTRPVPDTPAGHVLLSMRSVGICGSDVHYWTHGHIGDFVVKAPMVLGHEASGVVVAVGEGVTHLSHGDRVAIEPGVPCAECAQCMHGRYNLCPSVKFCATPPVDGSLANYVSHKASFCYKLPTHVSFDEAALLEPLSVGIHACRRGGVSLGHTVLITGAGPIGLVALYAARAAGASTIVITDMDTERLSVAQALGADRTITVLPDSNPKTLADGVDAHVCIDASGVESAVTTCIFGARPGGVVVMVGMGKPELTLPVHEASSREVDLRGVFRYCNTYPAALQLVESGKIDLCRLITHRFPLAAAEKAFQTANARDSKSIKVVIDCTPAT